MLDCDYDPDIDCQFSLQEEDWVITRLPSDASFPHS